MTFVPDRIPSLRPRAPFLALHKKHGILTQSFGALTPSSDTPPAARSSPSSHASPLRISEAAGKPLDAAAALLLWTRVQGVGVATARGDTERIEGLAEVARLPDLLTVEEVEEISRVGKIIHSRYCNGQMEEDFPLLDLPSE